MGQRGCMQLLLLSLFVAASLLQTSAGNAADLAKPDYSIYLKK